MQKIMKRKNSFFTYWIVLWLILFSGSLFFQVLNVRLTMIIIGLALFIFLLSGWKIVFKNLLIGLAWCIFIILNALLTTNYGLDTNSLILQLFRICICVIISSNFSFKNYSKAFVNIMVFESILSIFCFLFQNVLKLGNLPLIEWKQWNSNSYFLTPYYTAGWLSTGLFDRNAGWFLEPGIHQIFLNLSLFFIISLKPCISRKKFWLKFLILFIAVLTTKSTTGYICLLLVISFLLLTKDKGKLHFISLKTFLISAFCIIFALVIINSSVITEKFAGMFTGQSSAATRLNDTIVGYSLSLTKPLFGYGLYNTFTNSILNLKGVINISNGFSQLLIGAGIPFGIVYLILIFLGARKDFNSNIISALVFLAFIFVCMNTEGGAFELIPYLLFTFPFSKKLRPKILLSFDKCYLKSCSICSSHS